MPRPASPAVAVWTLTSGRTRSAGNPTPFQITSSTQRIVVEIVLEHPAVPGSHYEVQLESNETGTLIWSAQLSPIVSADGARFMFDIPKKRMKSGNYSFIVSVAHSPGAKPENCDFQVSVSD